jgi:acyl-CoA dehydrogenase
MSGLASWLLAEAGLPLPEGITTCALAHPRDDLLLSPHAHGWTASGTLHRVPWGAAAQQAVALARAGEEWRVVVLTSPSRVERGRNHADEPRDTLHYDGVLVAPANAAVTALTTEDLLARGALLRAASIAGAMERVLEMTLDHAENREQFGRPLSAFQAVQHHLVAIAEESVCASMAVRAAAAVEGPAALLAIAAAKTTAGEGARIVAARAHQVHGAIGTTQEHALHWFTTRLWSWQDECGSTQAWSRQIGQAVLRDDPQNLWSRISASVHGAGRGAPTPSALAARS